MITLILIIQTYTGALAYEYGPYPDVVTCEKFAEKHTEEIKEAGPVLNVAVDCRLINPEVQELAEADNL